MAMIKEFEFEVAYSVEEYAKENNIKELGNAQNNIEVDIDLAKKLAKEEIEELCKDHDFELFIDKYKFKKIEFVELDSHKWHGSAYWNITIESEWGLMKTYEMIYTLEFEL